jgi:hypothetical protein
MDALCSNVGQQERERERERFLKAEEYSWKLKVGSLLQ